MAFPDSLNVEGIHSYKVEGTGYDFIPKNQDRPGVIDKWIKSNDEESFRYSRRLIREEGLLVGGSSGSVMSAALQIAKDLPEDKRVVCVFVDSVRNYMTKFLNDDWLLENNFMDQKIYDERYFSQNNYFAQEKTVNQLNLTEVPTVDCLDTVSSVLQVFASTKSECVSLIKIFKLVTSC